jgi:ectoine hydroxylase-related dioxygenase (phytanoyl-CoA dioxygenase family)
VTIWSNLCQFGESTGNLDVIEYSHRRLSVSDSKFCRNFDRRIPLTDLDITVDFRELILVSLICENRVDEVSSMY